MLRDRDIASDCMEMHKHGAVDLTRMALECNNPQLRQTLITMRNKCEQSQYELAQMAASKGWYVPSPGADSNEINQVSQSLSQIVGY